MKLGSDDEWRQCARDSFPGLKRELCAHVLNEWAFNDVIRACSCFTHVCACRLGLSRAYYLRCNTTHVNSSNRNSERLLLCMARRLIQSPTPHTGRTRTRARDMWTSMTINWNTHHHNNSHNICSRAIRIISTTARSPPRAVWRRVSRVVL
jgi:hypothetical protein